jgi:drug/metabolite transporter (DMT)-like permease
LPIGLSFCCYLVLILPVFPLVSRLQILPAVMSREKADSPLVSRITGIVQLGFIMAMQLANVNIGIAIGITGAVMAFLVCFLYPIIQHLQCNYL